ncbi:MAG: C-terminal binding protein [Candidatus Tectomicrobia bacterium]|nr:C-terminal binding protein [Candidatus Tectomicrobia bacterium]
MPFKVLVTDYVWPSIEPEKAVLERIGAELVVAPDSSEDTLAGLAGDVDGILTCFAQVTDKVLRAAEKCIVVGRYGVGVDNIAVDTATELGMAVTYVPDYCVEEVSDHVLGLLLTWNRRVAYFDRMVKTSGWGSLSLTMPILRLRGKKLGIVGFGRIGQVVCRKALAFGFEVLTSDPFVPAETATQLGASMVGMQELLRESDFITLHSPLIPETRNLIGAAELDLMKSTAFLINCARGPLIDEEALYEALKNNRIGGAGLDVLVDAHPAPDHPLLKLENAIITPHVAFFSEEAVLELEERAAEEGAAVLQGRRPKNLVNKDVLAHANPRHQLPRG